MARNRQESDPNNELSNVFKKHYCSSDYRAMKMRNNFLFHMAMMAVLYSDDKHFNTASDNDIVFW